MGVEWGPPLLPWMLEAVQSLGFDRPTPVQAASIPLLAGNKDVVAEAVTGSGKTLAFVLPALIRLSKLEALQRGQTNVVIICPTRELAHQTYRVLRSVIDLAPDPKLYRTQLVTGGTVSPTIADVKNFLALKPHILVATPGRLLELLKSQHVRTSAVDLLVLDEADRLLDLGVDQTVTNILGLLPKQKRVGLFSATMDADIIRDIIRAGMRNPVKVSVRDLAASSLPDRLQIRSLIAKNPVEKVGLALRILQNETYRKAIVYIPTCTAVSHWYSVFGQVLSNIELHSLHGKLQQGPRVRTLQRFTETLERSVLLTTDVAARGLDIPDVDLVLQLDMPSDASMFVHRAGRTARAGRSGTCVALLMEGLEEGYIDLMAVRKVPIIPWQSPYPEALDYLQTLQSWVRKDRTRHDLALRSFLSFVRFYSRHSASSIFRIGVLDLFEVARSFGVLRMPRMPELKNRDLPNDGWLIEPFDMDKWEYTDPQQERARKAKIATGPSETGSERAQRKRNAVAWSEQRDRKESASMRREKRQKRAISKKMADPVHHRTELDSSDEGAVTEDWKELVQQRKKAKKSSEFVFNT